METPRTLAVFDDFGPRDRERTYIETESRLIPRIARGESKRRDMVGYGRDAITPKIAIDIFSILIFESKNRGSEGGDIRAVIRQNSSPSIAGIRTWGGGVANDERGEYPSVCQTVKFSSFDYLPWYTTVLR